MTEQPSGAGQPLAADQPLTADQPQYSAGPSGADATRPAAPGYSGPRPSDAKGFLAALFDFGFDAFVTPKIVKVIYMLIMILAGLYTLGFIGFAFATSLVFGILALVIIGPLFFLINIALWRMLLEVVMTFFRMADHLQAIREQGGSR